MADPQLLLMGQDLFALGLIEKLPSAKEKKTFQRKSVIANDWSFNCRNIDNFFSTGNSVSPFNNNDWMYSPIEYKDEDGTTRWKGVLVDVVTDQHRKTAALVCKDALFHFREKLVTYTSSDWETGAEAALNIMDSCGFTDYSISSLNTSKERLEDVNAELKCNFLTEDGITMFKAIQMLGLYSAADVYTHHNDVYFDVWQPIGTRGTSVNINIDKKTRPLAAPKVQYIERIFINDYQIDYDGSGDVPLTDASAGNIGEISRIRYGTKSLQAFDTGTEKQVVFRNTTTAQAIGEKYIRRSNANLSTVPRTIMKIAFELDYSFKYVIELGLRFSFTLSDENWDRKLFEVFEYDMNRDTQRIKVVGYELL